ncbi:MAG TPA: ABC transporter permease subunit [Chitinophagaceae bacterium]|nr:ABC transporter permease subunit [Chitinophagaceae bacterium]
MEYIEKTPWKIIFYLLLLINMMSLLKIEIFKIFKRPRTYIAFAVIALIILLIQIALKFGGGEYVGLMLSGMSDSFEEIPSEIILNGYLVCFIILNLLLIHVPILVALVSGDAIAGEANMGTLRLLASKPFSRIQLLIVKFIASVFYTLILLVWVALLALFVSMIIFGVDWLGVARELEFNVMEADDVLWRYALAFGFAAIGLICVAGLSFMLSVFADNSIGPIVTTVCVIIVFTILTQMQIPFYDETIKPYLFTTHMLGWKGFFYVKAVDGVTVKGSIENLPAVLKSAGILIVYTVGFLAVAFWHFNKKNILS